MKCKHGKPPPFCLTCRYERENPPKPRAPDAVPEMKSLTEQEKADYLARGPRGLRKFSSGGLRRCECGALVIDPDRTVTRCPKCLAKE